jgi:hypothetical protein
MEANAKNRFVRLSETAPKHPQTREAAAPTTINGCHIACNGNKAVNKSCKRSPKTATFTGNIKNAVIGSGAPSYTSTAHRCPGTAETLKERPTKKNAVAI